MKKGKGLPHGPVVKNAPCNAGDMGLISGLGTKILQILVGITKPARATTKSPQAVTKDLHDTMKIPSVATKTRHSQINKKEKEKTTYKMGGNVCKSCI